MFTGIIEQTGTIVSVEERAGVRRITVEAPGIAERLKEGDSCAVSGVCLTALDVNPKYFYADLAAETVARTSLVALKPGSKVNLELPTAAGSPLGGHVVQGHVDGTGKLVALNPVTPGAEETDWWLKVSAPTNVRQYMVEKGSIAIEGISLTIAGFERTENIVTVAILPLTYWRTNLHSLEIGCPVNVEADVLLKFAAQQQKDSFQLTEAFLIANGY
jgi:riboflavin synthase